MRLDNCILTFMLVNRSIHSIIKVNNIQFILLNANLVFSSKFVRRRHMRVLCPLKLFANQCIKIYTYLRYILF